MLGSKEYQTFRSEEFVPLHIEIVATQIHTAIGTGKLYRIFQSQKYKGEMHDPEMCFIVVDNRPVKTDIDLLHIYPTMYRQDNMDINDESVRIENSQVTGYIHVWQKDQCVFANMWLNTIKQQGFLQPIKK